MRVAAVLDVLGCIYYEHNIYLVLLAACLCLAGSAVTLRLLRRGVKTSGIHRFGWSFLASVAGGGSVWATHFVAMLAYEPRAPISFDPTVTILSLVIAIVGLFISFALAGLGNKPVMAVLGGSLAGLTFATMHYTGMFAYRVTGMISWDFAYIWVSIFLAVGFTAVSTSLIWQKDVSRSRFVGALGCMVLGIVGLHFTGMTAFSVTPMSQNFAEIDVQAITALALAIAIVAVIILGTGITSYLLDTDVRASSRERLHHVADHDALTGLPNRTHFGRSLTDGLEEAATKGLKLALIKIDLNHFKEVNDALGHAAGDQVLLKYAEQMRKILLDGELFARTGGDEFSAFKLGERQGELLAFAKRLQSGCNCSILIGETEVEIRASVGVAIWPDDAQDIKDLMSNSDLATYDAKRKGGGICVYDHEIGASVRDRRLMAEQLRTALDEDRLTLHYQVQKSLEDEKVIGYEALLRWQHPERGQVSPELFIPIAEENGLIKDLGAWVLRQACQDAADWDPDILIAVNVSAIQFVDPDFSRQVHTILLETGLSPRRLELELTETALVQDRALSLHIMRQLKLLGIKIALDDFGTGYSSLDILRSFPFDKIKLDKSFVDDIERDRQSIAIVRAVLAMGTSLDIPVLAEGIETLEQMAILSEEGCNEGQGFLLGIPAPLDKLGYEQAGNIEMAPALAI